MLDRPGLTRLPTPPLPLIGPDGTAITEAELAHIVRRDFGGRLGSVGPPNGGASQSNAAPPVPVAATYNARRGMENQQAPTGVTSGQIPQFPRELEIFQHPNFGRQNLDLNGYDSAFIVFAGPPGNTGPFSQHPRGSPAARQSRLSADDPLRPSDYGQPVGRGQRRSGSTTANARPHDHSSDPNLTTLGRRLANDEERRRDDEAVRGRGRGQGRGPGGDGRGRGQA